MRKRTGNPYREAHGRGLRVYELIADGTKSAAEIAAAVQIATGLRFTGDPAGQHGYINTATNADGSRFVAVVLYEACADVACPTGHGAGRGRPAIPHLRASDLTPVQEAALAAAAGEDQRRKLTGAASDAAVLRSLGYRDADPPLRAEDA